MWVGLIILFILAVILVYAFKQYAIKKGLLDNPNHRSAHTIPTPRGGGIVFIVLWLVFLIFYTVFNNYPTQQFFALFPALVALAIISFLDDKMSISSRWRFLLHFLAAFYFVVLLGGLPFINVGVFIIHQVWVFSVLSIIALVWSTNLFNFMDGSDGLAALEAIFIFLVGGLLLLLNYQAQELALICFALVASVAGFLCWNWPKAKIFMGDVGSACLGFLVVAVAILAQKFYDMPILLWIMLYGLFVFDATVTLVRRILMKEKWYEGHRSHAYQRLNKAGWSHQKILWVGLLSNLVILILVVIASLLPHFMPLFALVELFFLVLAYCWVERIFPMRAAV